MLRGGLLRVQLAIGIPPAYYGSQGKALINYFRNRSVIRFKYRDKGYAIYIGDNVFYVKDENNIEELFMVFWSSQELQTIILGTLARNITCMITRIPKSLCMKFDELEAEAVKEHHDVIWPAFAAKPDYDDKP